MEAQVIDQPNTDPRTLAILAHLSPLSAFIVP